MANLVNELRRAANSESTFLVFGQGRLLRAAHAIEVLVLALRSIEEYSDDNLAKATAKNVLMEFDNEAENLQQISIDQGRV